MTNATQTVCRWCSGAIEQTKRGQRFCCSSHRYLWHQAQRISPARFEERVRAIVREELSRWAHDRAA